MHDDQNLLTRSVGLQRVQVRALQPTGAALRSLVSAALQHLNHSDPVHEDVSDLNEGFSKDVLENRSRRSGPDPVKTRVQEGSPRWRRCSASHGDCPEFWSVDTVTPRCTTTTCCPLEVLLTVI